MLEQRETCLLQGFWTWMKIVVKVYAGGLNPYAPIPVLMVHQDLFPLFFPPFLVVSITLKKKQQAPKIIQESGGKCSQPKLVGSVRVKIATVNANQWLAIISTKQYFGPMPVFLFWGSPGYSDTCKKSEEYCSSEALLALFIPNSLISAWWNFMYTKLFLIYKDFSLQVTTFIMMYRTHCQRILDTVIRANFDEVRSLLTFLANHNYYFDNCLSIVDLK